MAAGFLYGGMSDLFKVLSVYVALNPVQHGKSWLSRGRRQIVASGFVLFRDILSNGALSLLQ